jgi:hypothetical protein
MHSSVSMNSRTYRSVQRHGGRRGRSRLIARSDLYQKAIDSESCVPGQQYGIEVNSNGNVHYSAGIDAGSGIGTVDDILPEHAADAVSNASFGNLFIFFLARYYWPLYYTNVRNTDT